MRKMVISSFISSILVLALGIWAYLKLESSMNIVAEKQLLIEPSRFSYKMWKDMPVTMYQSFTFFNLTNWNQVKAIGQKPRFVEVGPYVYRTIWTKSDINFMDEEKLVSFAEKKQWIFQPHLSKGLEDDQIWTINTPLMTALALIQNAPVITRNIVSVILDGLGEGAFIKRNIKSLLFEGYSDLIVSVGPLFDRRFSNFNGKFAYLYNKNDSVDGIWTVSTGTDDISTLNKITRFQSNIVNMTNFSSGQLPQGLNEVKAECAPAWSLDQSTNGQLFSPFNKDAEQIRLQQQLQQLRAKSRSSTDTNTRTEVPTIQSKRFFSRSAGNSHENHHHNHHHHHSHPHSNLQQQQQQLQLQQYQQDLVPNPFLNQKPFDQNFKLPQNSPPSSSSSSSSDRPQLKDIGKFIFYPDLCRPIHLLSSKQDITTDNGIQASRYYIDPRVFMNSTQVPTNRCYEMNPRPPLANALAATINSVTGANVAMPNLVASASSPFAMFSPPNNHQNNDQNNGGLFERSNHPTGSFLNNALHSLSAATTSDQQASSTNNAPISRLGRVRQLFSNIVSQRMSAAGPGSLLPSLSAGPAGLLIGNHFTSPTARNSPDDSSTVLATNNNLVRQNPLLNHGDPRLANNLENIQSSSNRPIPIQSSAPPVQPTAPVGGSDRWITQFRFKWPRGVFSIGQCQLGAPIYASLPHFLDADEYYLEQVDGLKPNRSLHEFYIDVESTLHSVPVGAKARLQLNVATPELRFRNIPNAMIPVLWQEVTFDIDKPIATMLYWSFTMSPTIYKLISIVLLVSGSLLLVASFVEGFRQHKKNTKPIETDTPPRLNGNHHSHHHHQTQGHQQEGQRSSWKPQMIHSNNEIRTIRNCLGLHNSNNCANTSSGGSVTSNIISNTKVNINNDNSSCNNNDTLDEIRHGAALNHAFSSCTEFHDRLNDNSARQNTNSGPNSGSIINGGVSGGCGISNGGGGISPKQPSSRASSHCELVSSLGTTVNCAGCLLACLRHSPNSSSNHTIHDNQAVGTSDNSIVIQQATSDIDKLATLSSRESNLSSFSSIFTQKSRAFK